MPIDLICLDADDTLWHTHCYFDAAARAFSDLLAPFATAGDVHERLWSVTTRNVPLYGYGAMSFTLSMIETAVELGGDALSADSLRTILAAGRDILAHPVELFPDIEATLDALAALAPLVLVTKGDLAHQEAKLASSGLGDRFAAIEIVSDKTPDTFRRVFARHGVPPDRAVMAGDSIRSDILPALEAGGWAAFVPPAISWSHEHAATPDQHPRFRTLERLADLPDWIDVIGQSHTP